MNRGSAADCSSTSLRESNASYLPCFDEFCQIPNCLFNWGLEIYTRTLEDVNLLLSVQNLKRVLNTPCKAFLITSRGESARLNSSLDAQHNFVRILGASNKVV